MRTLHWSSRYRRSFKRIVKQRSDLHDKIFAVMERLTHDPYAPELKTHTLRGILEGTWACSVEYDVRILFEFVEHPQTRVQDILLIDIGTHEEVY